MHYMQRLGMMDLLARRAILAIQGLKVCKENKGLMGTLDHKVRKEIKEMWDLKAYKVKSALPDRKESQAITNGMMLQMG